MDATGTAAVMMPSWEQHFLQQNGLYGDAWTTQQLISSHTIISQYRPCQNGTDE